MTEIAGPILGPLPTLDTEIDQDLEVLFREDLARSFLVDIGFGFSVD